MKTSLQLSNQLKSYSILFFTAVMLCLVSCKKDDHEVTKTKVGEVSVKLINATQNGAIDFYIDNSKINMQSLTFGEISDKKVSSGLKNTFILKAGVENSSAEFNFIPSFSYTAFYVEDKLGKGEILTFEDNLGSTEAGKARIRFVNLSPNFSNTININLTGNILLVNSLAFKESSMYFSIDPNVDMSISVLGTGGAKILKGTEFEPGKIYTVWLSGTNNTTLNINKITYN